MADQAALVYSQGLCAYHGTRQIVQNVDFCVLPGEFVAIAGANGTGKTTLLHCLTGYHEAATGTVLLRGSPVKTLPREQVAQQVAFVPQFTESVYGFSVREMVLMGRFPYGGIKMVHSAADAELADCALTELNAAHLGPRKFNELSGGERQLVLLARAVVQNAPLLIMDEPLTGLDLRHQFQVMQALQRLSQRPGAGVIATFHDLQAAARWCSRLVLLKDGAIAADGLPREILTARAISDIYGVQAQVSFGDQGDLLLSVSDLAGTTAEHS